MIQIELKAKHYYYIVYYLRDGSIRTYASLINRITNQLKGNNNFDQLVTVEASSWEVASIFRILTALPEGQANMINTEMNDLLEPQIIAGVTQEMTDGIGPDIEGNLPENAYWQIIARDITFIKTFNSTIRTNAINEGKALINTL
jgi:hypothetical protein